MALTTTSLTVIALNRRCNVRTWQVLNKDQRAAFQRPAAVVWRLSPHGVGLLACPV